MFTVTAVLIITIAFYGSNNCNWVSVIAFIELYDYVFIVQATGWNTYGYDDDNTIVFIQPSQVSLLPSC